MSTAPWALPAPHLSNGPRRPSRKRAEWMERIAQALGARMEEIAALIAQEVGMPVKLAHMIQAGLPTMDFGSMPKVMTQTVWEQQLGNSLIVREPIGVVGAITPWNYPLHQVCAKVAPALAAGCTIVVKPSEVAPLSAFMLADILDELGLPAGVFNLVTGVGPVVGEALAAHPDVDMISFTGSTRAGKRVSEVAAGTVKKVALELGGKPAEPCRSRSAQAADPRFRGLKQQHFQLSQAVPETGRQAVQRSMLRIVLASFVARDRGEDPVAAVLLAEPLEQIRVPC